MIEQIGHVFKSIQVFSGFLMNKETAKSIYSVDQTFIFL
jgi:hypothetical protein